MKALPDEGCNQMQSGRESARHGGGMKALPPPEALPPPQGQPLLRPQGRFASPLPLGSTPPVQSLPRPPPGAPPQLPPAWYMDTDCHTLPLIATSGQAAAVTAGVAHGH